MAKNIVKDEEYPIFIVSDKNFSINDDYITLLSNIKQRFKNSQIKAAVRINDGFFRTQFRIYEEMVFVLLRALCKIAPTWFAFLFTKRIFISSMASSCPYRI